MSDRPCKEFVTPRPDQGYGAYCGRCHYDREAHEKWDEWGEVESTKQPQVTSRSNRKKTVR